MRKSLPGQRARVAKHIEWVKCPACHSKTRVKIRDDKYGFYFHVENEYDYFIPVSAVTCSIVHLSVSVEDHRGSLYSPTGYSLCNLQS